MPQNCALKNGPNDQFYVMYYLHNKGKLEEEIRGLL